MKKSDYNEHLDELQTRLVMLQRWVKHTGARIVVVFEGRDTAGKGGMIKQITAKVSPRIFRVVALPAPTEREMTQLYMQRYMQYMPAAGEVVLFDRSWYNRACVEPVMGFCTPEETDRFLRVAPRFEDYIVSSGILLIKYWLEVSSDVQKKRLTERIDEPSQAMEAKQHRLRSPRALVRIFTRARSNVRAYGHRNLPMAYRAARTTSARHGLTASAICWRWCPTKI